MYKVFGSKRGLYLAALRWHLEHQVRPLLMSVSTAPDPAQVLRDTLVANNANPDLDLLLLAAVERAPVDPEVAEEIARTLRDFDAVVDLALGGAPDAGAPSELAYALAATILGLRLRARSTPGPCGAGTVLFDRIHQSRH